MGYFDDLRDGLVECDDDEEQEMLMAGFEPDDAEDRRLWRMGYRTHPSVSANEFTRRSLAMLENLFAKGGE